MAQQPDRLPDGHHRRDKIASLWALYDAVPQLFGIGEIDGERLVVISSNAATEAFFSLTFEEMTGGSGAELRSSPAVDRLWLDAIRTSERQGKPVTFEYLDDRISEPCWLEVTVSALGAAVSGRLRYGFIAQDISNRKQHERFREFLLQLSDTLRPLADARKIQAEATRALGEYLQADRAYYGEFDDEREVFVVQQEYLRDGGMSLAGVHPIAGFGPVIDVMRRGERFIISDIQADPRAAEADHALFMSLALVSSANVPLIKGGITVAAMGVTQATTRDWTEAEIALIEATAERTWEAVERARAEAALRDSEERFRTLFDSIDQGFCTIEVLFDDEGLAQDYRVLEINPAFERNTGLDATAIGQRMRVLAPDHEPYWYDIYGQVALSRESVRFEAEAAALGRWYNVYAYPVGDPAEHKVGVLFEDITERRAALAALQQSESRYRTLIQNLPDYAIFLLDPTGVITEWSEGAERITGYLSEDALGRPVSILYPPEEGASDELERELAEAARVGRLEREGWHERKDGSRYWSNEIVTAVYDARGNLSGYTKISRDLTAQRSAEEQLRASEARAGAIVEAATDYAIFTVSADARIQDWFAGAEAVFGWRAEEAIGQPFAMTFTPDDRAQGVPERELSQAEQTGSAPDVRWHQHKDGSQVFIDGVTRALFDLEGTFLGALKIGQDVTERRLEARLRIERDEQVRHELEAQVAATTAQLRAISRRLLLVQEEERRYLARELHDEIGQVLTGLALSLSTASMTEAQRADAQRLVAELTEQVRQLSIDLRPPALDAYGLLPALRGYIERYEARTGIMIELRTEGLERRFPAPVEITVYRIAQEALTNMARHSGTQHAVMQLLADDRTLAVSIRDTGRGFDPLAVREGSGLGGMRERVELLGGVLDIDAVPGSGVTITAELPLSAETEGEQL